VKVFNLVIEKVPIYKTGIYLINLNEEFHKLVEILDGFFIHINKVYVTNSYTKNVCGFFAVSKVNISLKENLNPFLDSLLLISNVTLESEVFSKTFLFWNILYFIVHH
jgi:hypothetical protein